MALNESKTKDTILRIATATAVFAALILTACPKAEPAGNYEFNPPSRVWTPMKGEDNTLLFKRESPEMGITVYTTCDRYLSAPLEPLGRELFIGFTNREIVDKGAAKVSGQEAFYIIVECELEGRNVKVKAYTFKFENCIYDIAYFAGPKDYDAGIDDFEKFVAEFKAK